MSARATALALALLLLAVSVPAATPMCCALRGRAERTIMSSMDCCAVALECPTAPQATVTAASAGTIPMPRDRSLLAQPSGSPDSATPFARSAAALTFLGPLPSCPPLYRLHSQLLI